MQENHPSDAYWRFRAAIAKQIAEEPDVVMIGEIRDEQSRKLAKEAADRQN